MAGIRQHILPRFLLKGFASQVQGKKIFTWVYRKDRKAFEASLNRVSVERYFYGEAGEDTADDKITSLESRYSVIIDDLRKRGDGTEIFDPRLGEIIAHLCIRTKHLRDSLRESSEYLIEKIQDYVSEPGNIKKLVLNRPDLMKETIEKNLDAYKIPPDSRNLVSSLVKQMLPSILESQEPEFRGLLQTITAEMVKMVPNSVRDSHIKALEQSPVPEPRAEDYKKLRWFVCESDEPLILGDCGCLFETEVIGKFKTLTELSKKLANVFLPIASNRVLLGSSKPPPPKIDFRIINQAAAKFSKDFFVSASQSSILEGYSGLIGIEAGIISTEELDRMTGDLFAQELAS